MEIKPGEYRHSKSGKEYRVHFVAKHSETLEDLVIYEALYENEMSKYWARPASVWGEEVEINGEKKPRFEFLD